MKHNLLRSAAAVLSACMLASCGGASSGSTAKTSGKALKIGVRTSIVNFGYQDPESGRFYGLDVDIGEELATRLGRSSEYIGITSSTREQMLQSGEVDCVIASYSITPERQDVFDFSPPYYQDTVRVIVENSTGYTSVKDIVGQTVGVLKDTNAAQEVVSGMVEMWLLRDYDADSFTAAGYDGDLRFREYNSYADLMAGLECGEIDAAAMDASIAKSYMDDTCLFLQEHFGTENYGVATQKGSELSTEIAEAMQQMLDDGTIDALIAKWNGGGTQ